jgi:hypothetical protein
MRAAKLLPLVVLALMAEMAAAQDAVVLVVGRDSPINEISLLDIRKAYLGISVSLGGGTVRPLRRNDDEQLNQIFMQTVIAMSERSYERRLLSLMLRFGTPRPEETDDRDELDRRLAERPYSIAYMWKSEAEADARVKVVRTLWQDH